MNDFKVGQIIINSYEDLDTDSYEVITRVSPEEINVLIFDGFNWSYDYFNFEDLELYTDEFSEE